LPALLQLHGSQVVSISQTLRHTLQH